MKVNRWFAFGVCLLMMVMPPLQAREMTANPPQAEFGYDKKGDKLSLNLKAAPLSKVLARVSLETGVGVLFDAEAERMVTIQMKDQPLEDGLKQLLKDVSHLFYYDNKKGKGGKEQLMLTEVRVLPKGKSDNSNLRPVVELEQEAFRRALEKGKVSRPESKKLDYTSKRWQARLDSVPLAMRERLLKDAEDRAKKHQENEKKREEQRAERVAKREAERKAREQQREEGMNALKASNPELYEIKMQRLEENRKAAAENVGAQRVQ